MSSIKDLCQAIAKASLTNTDVVGDGWYTVKQLAKQTDTSISTMTRKLSVLVSEGKVETKKFRVATSKSCYPIPHYRYVKTKKRTA